MSDEISPHNIPSTSDAEPMETDQPEEIIAPMEDDPTPHPATLPKRKHSEPRGILKRAVSTDEAALIRRASLAGESLDAATLEGILRRKRGCLSKTVSFSETVSQTTFTVEAPGPQPSRPRLEPQPPRELHVPLHPLVPPPSQPQTPQEPQTPSQPSRSEGEYVEQNVNPMEVPRRPVPACYLRKEDLLPEQPPEDQRTIDERNLAKERRQTGESRRRGETPRKQLTVEDLPRDEDPDEFGIRGVYKCGLCTVGFAPVKKKKVMFVTLSERALELHESEKSFRYGKAAKHIVDLSISFNVHSEHFDAKMKKCLCLMGPDETICIRPEGGISTIEGWRRALVKGIHDSRRRKINRTPRPEDIFDAVYDIRVVLHMKSLEKYVESRKEHGFTNICTAFRELMGKKRLCLYPNSLAIADLRIEPTAYGLPPAGFPPFRSSNCFVIDRSTVAFYGFRENYFYIRIGKGSPYRGFEILFQVESNEVCKEIYSRLKFLIDRDLEVRRVEAMRRPDPTLVVKPRVPTAATIIHPLRIDPRLSDVVDPPPPHLRKRNSTQSERGDVNIPEQERKMSDNRPRRKPFERPSGEPETSEPPRLTMPPLKLNANKPSGEYLLGLQRDEETRKNGFDPRTHNPDGSLKDLKDIKKDYLDVIESQPDPEPEDEDAQYARIVNSQDYTLMGPGEMPKHEEMFKDDQSDSGDSCYSSKRSSMCKQTKPHLAHLGCQLPSRAQSFGGNYLKNPTRIPPTVNLPDVERKTSAAVGETSKNLQPPEEDPRKRAFSLGSRHFFNSIGFNDFRRLVGKRNRNSSPKNASTSGISVNSSNASPSSGSINCLTSADNLNAGRPGSPGSGRNSPAQKLMGSNPGMYIPKKRSQDDLVSIDFSNLGRKDSKEEERRRYPFGGAPPGRPIVDYNTEIKEKEDEERRNRERRAIEFKRKEEQEARELAEKKREEERRAQEKKDKKREEKEMKEFRPKADSGIADCTPSSSFSGKQGEKKNDSGDYVYSDPEGMKFLANIRKNKKQNEDKTAPSSQATTPNKEKAPRIVEQTIIVKMVEKMSAVDVNRRSSLCAEINRKGSVCAAIKEENEVQSETESRGEPAERKASVNVPPVTRKPSSSTSSMSPFKRLKFLSFRK